MKKKMFAMLTISFMVMAAFGAMAVVADNESVAEDTEYRFINEQSGTVGFVPDSVYISMGGSASFIPITNWVAGIEGNHKTVITVVAVDLNSTIPSEGSGDGTDCFEVSVSDDKVTVTGLAEEFSGDYYFKVEVTVKVYYMNGSSDVLLRTISTTSEEVHVYVYDALKIEGDLGICYHGVTYRNDFSDVVSGGSENYAISVEGLPEGLYMLGNVITGKAYLSAFDEDASDEGVVKVTVTVVDTVTGAKVSNDEVEMTMSVLEPGDLRVYSKLGDTEVLSLGYEDIQDTGAIFHVNQKVGIDGETTYLEFTMPTPDPTGSVVILVDGVVLELGTPVDGKYTVELPTTVIGMHSITLLFGFGEYMYHGGSFNMLVMYNGMDFILPHPEIGMTLVE